VRGARVGFGDDGLASARVGRRKKVNLQGVKVQGQGSRSGVGKIRGVFVNSY
jgi:hypothetical protein